MTAPLHTDLAAPADLALCAACARLCDDFAYHVDHRDYAAVTGLFTEDGTFMRQGETLRGRAAILAAMQARPADTETRYVCTNVRIDACPVPGAARGTSNLTLHRGPRSGDGVPAVTVIAEFTDDYRLTPEGWRIASRVVTAAF